MARRKPEPAPPPSLPIPWALTDWQQDAAVLLDRLEERGANPDRLERFRGDLKGGAEALIRGWGAEPFMYKCRRRLVQLEASDPWAERDLALFDRVVEPRPLFLGAKPLNKPRHEGGEVARRVRDFELELAKSGSIVWWKGDLGRTLRQWLRDMRRQPETGAGWFGEIELANRDALVQLWQVMAGPHDRRRQLHALYAFDRARTILRAIYAEQGLVGPDIPGELLELSALRGA